MGEGCLEGLGIRTYKGCGVRTGVSPCVIIPEYTSKYNHITFVALGEPGEQISCRRSSVFVLKCFQEKIAEEAFFFRLISGDSSIPGSLFRTFKVEAFRCVVILMGLWLTRALRDFETMKQAHNVKAYCEASSSLLAPKRYESSHGKCG
jgi:hypothetical protein